MGYMIRSCSAGSFKAGTAEGNAGKSKSVETKRQGIGEAVAG